MKSEIFVINIPLRIGDQSFLVLDRSLLVLVAGEHVVALAEPS